MISPKRKHQNSLTRLLGDNSGATMIEYALIGTLVALALIASLTALGGALGPYFDNITAAL